MILKTILKALPVVAILLFLPALHPLLYAADMNYAFGAGGSIGTVEGDEISFSEDFKGFAVFGHFGFNERWGLFVSARSMEASDIDSTATELGVYGRYLARPGKKVRPHFKAGLVNISEDSQDDSAVGLSVGGGLEVGPKKVAFFSDYEISQVTFNNEDFFVRHLTLGVVWRL